jgi:O-antigen ligase
MQALLSISNRNLFWLLSGLFLICLAAALVYESWYIMALPFTALAMLPFITIEVKHLYYALLLSLPVSVEYQFGTTLGTDLVSEPIMLLLTALYIFNFVHNPRIISRRVYAHPLFYLLVLHFVWIAVSVFYSEHVLFSSKYLLAKIWYIVPFVLLPQVLVNRKQDMAAIAVCLALPMLFVAAQSILRHLPMGFSFSSINDTLTPFFRNHVNYSAMLVCLIPAGLVAFYFGKNTSLRLLLLVVLIVAFVALILAYSRGAWLAAFAAYVCWWAIRRKKIQQVLLLAVLLTGGLLAWLSYDRNYLRFAPNYDNTIFHTNFREHINATFSGRDVSTAERFYRWVAGVRMAAAEPVTGFGPNTFYGQYHNYTVRAFRTWVSDNSDHSTVHNYFLLLAAEQGLPGMIIFVLLFAGALLYAQRLFHRLRDTFYKMSVMAIAATLTMIGVVNFLSDLIETDKIGSLFFLCIGLLIRIGILTEDPVTQKNEA